MVSKSTNKRAALATVVFAGIFALSFVLSLAIMHLVNGPTDVQKDEPGGEIVEPEPEPEPEPIIDEIDFQPLINEWASSAGGSVGIVVYDLDLGKVAGEYNPDTKFATASLYKLFVVYEGYRHLTTGAWNGDDAAGYTGYTISKCLDLAIRESHSPCAETLWSMIGHGTIDAVVQNDFGLTGLTVGSLSATPREIMQMMKIYFDHTEITDEALVTAMKDSFLNQPTTTYNWRQGLPSGFSDAVLVYNKVGWNWNGSRWTIYDDAAIIDFPELNRHFIVVVMTSGVTYQQIRNFGTQVENLVNSTKKST